LKWKKRKEAGKRGLCTIEDEGLGRNKLLFGGVRRTNLVPYYRGCLGGVRRGKRRDRAERPS